MINSIRKSLTILLAIIYSTLINHLIIQQQQQSTNKNNNNNNNYQLLLSLRYSSLTNLLPHIIYESILISSLSHNSFSSFGACLHLLKLPLISTVYRYFTIQFNPDISRSILFDSINYLGQFIIFYYSLSSSPNQTQAQAQVQQRSLTESKAQQQQHPKSTIDSDQIQYKIKQNIKRQAPYRINHLLLISLLTWILISLIDGLVSYLLERSLSNRISTDLDTYLNKQRLDQYFLLKTSQTTQPSIDILRRLPPRSDRSMIDHQLWAPIINLPYFFSPAALISLPSDFILLDRLPMLSLHTKSIWLIGLVARRFLYSLIAWFLKS